MGSFPGLLRMIVVSMLLLEGSRVLAQDDAALVVQGRRIYEERGCDGCHAAAGGIGERRAPDLSAVGRRYSLSYLTYWLAANPYRGGRHMPKIELTEAELSALAAYLTSLRGF